MASAAYSFGRWLGRNKMPAALVAGFSAPAYMGVSMGIEESRRDAEAKRAATAQANDAATRASFQAAQVRRCVDGIANEIQTAEALLKAGSASKALQYLDQCRTTMTDDKAKALYARLEKLVQAEDAKEARAKELREAAEERQARAQRKREGVRIGMSEQDALDSSWGKPRKINRTTTAYGVREQWVYDGGYLYFRNGVLTSIQN